MAGLFFDTMERIHEGPRVKERDFDLGIARRSKELAEEYDIKYDPAHVVSDDDAMADRLFEAAMEFAVETGLWCLDTQRVVKFTKSEILQFLCNYHTPLVLGRGKDQVVLEPRKPESSTRCLVMGGGAGAEISEALYVKHMMNLAIEPTVDAVSCVTPNTIEGMMIRPGSPIEVQGTLQEAGWLREAIRRVGRPDMPFVTSLGCASTAAAAIAGIDEGRGIRRGDLMLATLLTEMKTEYDPLVRATVFVQNGLHVVALYAPMIGGWAGGPESAAIVGTATCLLSGPAYNATIADHHPVHIGLKSGANTRPDTLWLQSISGQAMSRNTVFPMAQCCFFDAPAGTKEVLYEAVANAIVAVTSGQHTGPGPNTGLWSEQVDRGQALDYITGIEQRMLGEVTRAVTGMTRKEGNEIVQKCLEKYMPTSGKQPLGKRMPELYDVARNKPKDEWVAIFEDVKETVSDWGVPFLY